MSSSASITPPRPPDGRTCMHCKQWVARGEAHDCWTTTEGALTRDLDDDLRDAYERLREEAAALGEQRIYAAHHSIMFAREICYCFVRPHRRWLEVCLFLGRTVTHPLVRRATPVSRTKVAHLLRVVHRDEIEAPLTDWLSEAWAFSAVQAVRAPRSAGSDAAPRRRAAKKR